MMKVLSGSALSKRMQTVLKQQVGEQSRLASSWAPAECEGGYDDEKLHFMSLLLREVSGCQPRSAPLALPFAAF